MGAIPSDESLGYYRPSLPGLKNWGSLSPNEARTSLTMHCF
jgi:hypothetical protein